MTNISRKLNIISMDIISYHRNGNIILRELKEMISLSWVNHLFIDLLDLAKVLTKHFYSFGFIKVRSSILQHTCKVFIRRVVHRYSKWPYPDALCVKNTNINNFNDLCLCYYLCAWVCLFVCLFVCLRFYANFKIFVIYRRSVHLTGYTR